MLSILNIPELSNYSDEEYERLVGQAKLRRGDAIWVLPGLAGLLAGLAWVGVGIGVMLAIKASSAAAAAAVSAAGGIPAPEPSMRGWAVGNLLVGVLIAVAVAVAVRWYLLVRSIKRLINRAGCPFCEFSLVGLRIEHGWVRCPECWQRVSLHEHRLSEEDILTDEEKRKPIKGLGAGPMGAYVPTGQQAMGRKR
jgi:hypothetical protein